MHGQLNDRAAGASQCGVGDKPITHVVPQKQRLTPSLGVILPTAAMIAAMLILVNTAPAKPPVQPASAPATSQVATSKASRNFHERRRQALTAKAAAGDPDAIKALGLDRQKKTRKMPIVREGTSSGRPGTGHRVYTVIMPAAGATDQQVLAAVDAETGKTIARIGERMPTRPDLVAVQAKVHRIEALRGPASPPSQARTFNVIVYYRQRR